MPECSPEQVSTCHSRAVAVFASGLILAFATATSLPAAAQTADVTAFAERPSNTATPVGIVLVLSDGVIAQQEGVVLSPQLRRLQSQGVRFTDVLAPSPFTTESDMAMRQSRWLRPGAVPAEEAEGSPATGLAQIFAEAGWSVHEVGAVHPPAGQGDLAEILRGVAGEPFVVLVQAPADDPADSGLLRGGGAESHLAAVSRGLLAADLVDDVLVGFVGLRGIDPAGDVSRDEPHSAAALDAELLVRWPNGWPAGKVVDHTISLIDVLPTLVDVAGASPVATHEGQSIVPLVLAPQAPSSLGYQRRACFAYTASAPRQAVLVDGGWKLVRRLAADGQVEHVLFDHLSDPGGTRDLGSRHPEIVRRLIRRLDHWLGVPAGGTAQPVS